MHLNAFALITPVNCAAATSPLPCRRVRRCLAGPVRRVRFRRARACTCEAAHQSTAASSQADTIHGRLQTLVRECPTLHFHIKHPTSRARPGRAAFFFFFFFFFHFFTTQRSSAGSRGKLNTPNSEAAQTQRADACALAAASWGRTVCSGILPRSPGKRPQTFFVLPFTSSGVCRQRR